MNRKYGMYTKSTLNEGSCPINTFTCSSKLEAESYFAALKRLSLNEFLNIFEVREIVQSERNLLLG